MTMLQGSWPAELCNFCDEYGRISIVGALGAKPVEGGGIRVYYECPDCQKRWWSSYLSPDGTDRDLVKSPVPLGWVPIEVREGSSREYARVHYLARKALAGSPCEKCGATSAIQAALRSDVPASSLLCDPKTNCLYSTDVAHYHPLCKRCHSHLDLVDGRPVCRSGHEYTPANTLIKRDGSRHCRTCNRERARARMVDPEVRAKKQARERELRKPLSEAQRARKTELQRLRRAAQATAADAS